MKVGSLLKLIVSASVLLGVGCTQSMKATLTIDPDGGTLFYYPEGSDTPVDVSADNPVFDSPGSYSYTAEADTEFPLVISTLQARKEGYRFRGWGNVIDNQVKGSYIQDFSNSRMPYADVLYRAFYDEYVTLTFVPVDEEFQPLVIGGEEVAPYTLNGEDIYTSVNLDNERLSSILDEMTALLPEEEYRSGQYSGIYESPESEKALTYISIESNTIYYVMFAEHPRFIIDWGLSGLGQESYPVAPGSGLGDYLPAGSEIPEVEGMVFEGWYVDPEYTSPFYPNDQYLTMPNADLTIYARYLREIPVDYQLPEGWTTGEGSPDVLLEGEIPDNLVDPISTEGGFTFTGWYIDMDGDKLYSEETDVLLDGSSPVPEGLEFIVLRPLLEEWDRLYIDLRGVSYDAQNLPSDLIEASRDIYYVPALLGKDISAWFEEEPYGFDSTYSFDGFSLFYLAEGEYGSIEELLDASENPEAGLEIVGGVTSMPPESIVARPRFNNTHEITLYMLGNEMTYQIVTGEWLDSYDDPIWEVDMEVAAPEGSDYLANVLTGWSLEPEGEPVEYPLELTTDVVALHALYTRRTSLILSEVEILSENEDEEPTVIEVEEPLIFTGLEGALLTLEEREQLEQLISDSWGTVAYYRIQDSNGNTSGEPNSGTISFQNTNATIVAVVAQDTAENP